MPVHAQPANPVLTEAMPMMLDETSREIDQDALITLFPNPLLLGQWFHQQQKSSGDTLTVWLEFKPDYQYEYYSYQNAEHVMYDKGSFDLNASQIRFDNGQSKAEYLDYAMQYNQMVLNGNLYYKTMPKQLLGHWASVELLGSDLNLSQADFIEIWLYDDFYFNFNAYSRSGKNKRVEGIYLVSGDRLVFFYEDGEFYTRFQVQNNRLVLKNTNFEMRFIGMKP
ncbi:MAG: hypothetical protein ACPHV3_02710 [Vibrio sp.]